jgi:hypothetical protein
MSITDTSKENIKVKVKFPLCPPKHHVMNTNPMLFKHHTINTYWRSGDTAPIIFNLGARWK